MAEDKDIIQIGETEVQDFQDLIMKRCKVWVVFPRPKDMEGNSQRPKGVVIAVCFMSSGWVGIWWYAVTRENFTYSTHSLYYFKDAIGKDCLCSSVACNLMMRINVF
jgi:hypothetical protein